MGLEGDWSSISEEIIFFEGAESHSKSLDVGAMETWFQILVAAYFVFWSKLFTVSELAFSILKW